MDTNYKDNELFDFDTAIIYAQVALHTLQNSGTDLNKKTIKEEMKMLKEKFSTKEVKRLAKIFLK